MGVRSRGRGHEEARGAARASHIWIPGPDLSAGSVDVLGFAEVGEEALQADVGERVAEQQLEDLERHRGDVRAGERALDDVLRVAHRGDEDLRRELVRVVDLHDLAHELGIPVLADVVDPARRTG